MTAIKDGAFASCSNITAFASEAAAFAARQGVLYSADGKALICVPDTLTLPHTVITSNISMRVTDHVDAIASGDLPYIIMSSTTNAPVSRAEKDEVDGDISFDALLSGVTKIYGYAFRGVNVFNDTATTTNKVASGTATPGDGSAHATMTSTLTITSITHYTPLSINPTKVEVAPDAFAESGISCTFARQAPAQTLASSNASGETKTLGSMLAKTTATYSGYIVDANGNPSGTVLVKVAKAKNGTAKVTMEIQAAGKKKQTLKSTVDVANGTVDGAALTLSERYLSGTYAGYQIEGARNLFTSSQKSEAAAANAALSSCPAVITVAWTGGALSLKVAAKGKVTVTGTMANGAKASAKSQLSISDNWFCIPVSLSKANCAFVIWIAKDGGEVRVDGLPGAIAGSPAGLRSGASFLIEQSEAESLILAALSSRAPYAGQISTDDLPVGVPLVQKGSTWSHSGSAALKLRYTEKNGTFKGSFKAFSTLNGKRKSTTVTVTGVVVGEYGYGQASIKKAGSIPVEIR